MTELRRSFGKWPTEAFKEMDADSQKDFYAKAHTLKNCNELKAFATQQLQRYEKHEQLYKENGEFLPLAVWATQGYDTDMIELNSLECDKHMCRTVGLTYRVPVWSVGKEGRKGAEYTRGENMEGQRKQTKAWSSASAEPMAMTFRACDEQKSEDDATSDESDTSSSSSSKKKRKKHHKSKSRAHKKARKDHHKKEKAKDVEKKNKADERTAAIAGRAQKREDDQHGKLAEDALALFGNQKKEIEQVLANPCFHELPSAARDSTLSPF